MPYYEKYDNVSWYYSQLQMFYKAYTIFRNYNMQYQYVRADAYEHHSYPKKFEWDKIIAEFSAREVPKV